MSDNQKQNAEEFCNGVWPSISDEESARGAIVYGLGWYLFSAAITAIIGFSSLAVGHDIAGYDSWSLVDAALFAVIAWRLSKNSRAWAVTGLVYESINVLYKLSEHETKVGIMSHPTVIQQEPITTRKIEPQAVGADISQGLSVG